MSTLSLNTLDKLIAPCSKYYGLAKTKEAIEKLKRWYHQQAFDDNDIADDWISYDFKNCHGIHVFFDCLNNTKLNNIGTKKVLFNWCCYWLWEFENIPKPKTKLIYQKETTIHKVAHNLSSKLTKHIPEFTQQIALDIAGSFVQICQTEYYTDLDELNTDMENIADSFIMDEISKFIAKIYPQYIHKKKQIFDILQSVIILLHTYNNNNNYPSFDLKLFSFEISTTTRNVTLQATNEIGRLFRSGRYQDTDQSDLTMANAKAIDFENQFPLLINLADHYARCRAEDNKLFWQQNLIAPKKSKSITLTVSQWVQRCEFFNYVKKQNSHMHTCITNAIDSVCKRALPKFNFNHVVGSTIFDSFDIFTRYVCAMNKFVHGLMSTENAQLPIQIDLWIIPRLTKTGVHHTDIISSDFNDIRIFDDKFDDDECQYLENDSHGKTQKLAKDPSHEIWELENNLCGAGYVKGADYWTDEQTVDDMFDTKHIKRNINKLWNKNVSTYSNDMRYKRYVLIIDRRNPKHIQQKQMIDDTHKKQTWNDRIYLITPKHKNKISKAYADVMNETFICNTIDYLFPMPSLATQLENGEYR
eukprot:417495_1